MRITPFNQFVDRDHVHSFCGHLDRYVAEAKIVINHFLLADAFQAQPGRLQNRGSLDSD